MIQFLIHNSNDDVGVAVTDIKKGETVTGLKMDTQESVQIKALCDIPLGHKIAMTDKKKGDTLTKYSNDIGKIVADFKVGEHVHVHNLKTKRW